jgi:hypothetical protein
MCDYYALGWTWHDRLPVIRYTFPLSRAGLKLDRRRVRAWVRRLSVKDAPDV